MAAADPPFFPQRSYLLRNKGALEQLLAFLRDAPLDLLRHLEVVVRIARPMRKKSANDRMWSGPLKDIEQQAWCDDGTGKPRRYRDVVWHDYFKRRFLPEEYVEGITRHEDYKKWGLAPDGERVLVASTKDLTSRGFSLYLQEIEVFGVEMGVKFSASPNEVPMI